MCYGSIIVTSKMWDYSKWHPIPCGTPHRGSNSAAPVSWKFGSLLHCAVRPNRRRCRATTLTLDYVFSATLRVLHKEPHVWIVLWCDFLLTPAVWHLKSQQKPPGPFLLHSKGVTWFMPWGFFRTVAWKPENLCLVVLMLWMSLEKLEND